MPKPTTVVLTGGPGAGKTVITRQIAADFPGRFALVPEAATQVYDALQTRWDRLDLTGRRDVQRKIYQLQVDQEERTAAAHPEKILLLDRGTIDGAAYWPEGPEDYWRDVRSEPARELARYDLVIVLQTCAVLGMYDGDTSNPVRFEDADAAVQAGELLQRLWGDHPKLRFVDACETTDAKAQRVLEILRAGQLL